ncbi:MAG: DUF302 domain-containing protein [bacterium]
MLENFIFEKKTDKSFDEVVTNIENQTAEHKFRVLAVHNVQETLAGKGFERGPLKIIEICNAGFAHNALQKDPRVALFMPCRYAVYTEDNKTVVKLLSPNMISVMMPEAGLDELAASVDETMKSIMKASV